MDTRYVRNFIVMKTIHLYSMFNDSTTRTHAICDKHDKFDNIVEQTNYKLTKSPVIGDTKLTKYTQYVYSLQSSAVFTAC